MGTDDEAIVTALMAAARDVPALMQFESRIGAHQYLRLWELARRYVAPGARVLDWGAGNGHFTWAAAELGFDVTACSFDPEPAWLGGRAPWVRTEDPIALPFAAGTFAAVFSVGVLEHVAESGGDEIASLREIRRLLAPGGVLVLYHLPNRWSWIEALARRIPGKHAHTRRFDARALARLLETAGFASEALGRYGLLPRNAARRLPKRLRGSPGLAGLYDAADRVLGAPLGAIAQNWYCVARAGA